MKTFLFSIFLLTAVSSWSQVEIVPGGGSGHQYVLSVTQPSNSGTANLLWADYSNDGSFWFTGAWVPYTDSTTNISSGQTKQIVFFNVGGGAHIPVYFRVRHRLSDGTTNLSSALFGQYADAGDESAQYTLPAILPLTNAPVSTSLKLVPVYARVRAHDGTVKHKLVGVLKK